MVRNSVIRILGVDPGTQLVGWAVVELEASWPPRIAASGVIKAGGASRPARLASIDFQLRRIAKDARPREIAVEDGYVGFGANRNPPAQLALAEARGVCIVAASCGRYPVSYYSPKEVKAALTGNGRADKERMMYFAQQLYRLPGLPDPDHADAIGVATCHANRIHSRR